MANNQLSIFDDQFAILISESTREDGWVDATKWCKHYGKAWYEFKRLPDSKKFIKTLEGKGLQETSGKIPVIKTVNRGRAGSVTWIHPLVAIKLAEWLNTEFEVYVKQTFKRYLDGDIALADDIIQRTNNQEDLNWIQARIEGKQTRKAFTDELKKRGVTGAGYAQNTNAVYVELFDKTAKTLKEERESLHLRDSMTELELAAVRFAELGAKQRFQIMDAYGNKETIKESKTASVSVRKALEQFKAH